MSRFSNFAARLYTRWSKAKKLWQGRTISMSIVLNRFVKTPYTAKLKWRKLWLV